MLTSLLLYFGFAYTDALYEHFGIDAATLGFSTQDYMLRSAGALYMPLGTTLGVGLTGVLGYYCVSSLGRSRPRLTPYLSWGCLALTGCGIALFTLGMLGGFQVWPAGALDTPLLLGGGLLLVVYGQILHVKANGRDYPVAREVAALAIVAALISLSSFWAVNAYAQEHGRSDARYLADNLWLRPEIVVDTAERLYFQHADVKETSLPEGGPGQRFRFRYQGLRLLAQSNNRMFVIPEGWRADQGSVLIIPTDANVRVAFRPG
ncbi:hypothetical protein QMK19_06120 [Streptomyces sp. H10-C2]|uniref:hypothetical protein n=1 Tax=unclassified Streptomyces TaxID=2593676 RepID=UPI0024BB80B4|nr:MULTISPECIES: hypothetical protein [unclassified Streptomyces]MDJ0340099.1 hypothetical protein [Streptomyces sp. PH10-H1]MDJ0369264.1 hypothetical protein [Streptomyces sp. H10-C2]